jgi:hypothetical protein
MATFYTNIAASDLTLNVRNRNNGDLTHGDVRFAEATYTTTGTEATSGDRIEVCVLPVGAVPVPELWRVSNEALMGGSSVLINTLGDTSDTDRYSTNSNSISINSSSAGSAAVTPNVAASVLPRHTVTEATQHVVATISRTNALTAGKKISFHIAYKL